MVPTLDPAYLASIIRHAMGFDPVVLGSNLALVDEMYARYLADQASVDPMWRQLFSNGVHLVLPAGGAVGGGHGSTTRPAHAPVPPVVPGSPSRAAIASAAVDARTGLSTWPLVNAHRVRGHMLAQLDPLELIERPHTIELEPATYGFTDGDLDKEYPGGGF